MEKGKKLGRNVVYLTAGNFASKLLSFFLIPLYTSVLSTSEYGVADILATTITLLTPIFTLQISESVIRFCLDKNADNDSVLSIGLFTISAGFFILVLLSPFLLQIKIIKQYYIFFLAYYFSSTLATLFSQYAKGIECVKVYAMGGILNTVTVILCNIIFLLHFKMQIYGYILSFIIGYSLTCFYLFLRLKFYQIHWHIDKALWKSMLCYSVPMIPNSINWWITNSSDKYMVTYLLGTAANGLYSIAYKIPSLMSTVNGIFMSAWHISAVEDFNSQESRAFFHDIYILLSSFDALAVSSLILCSKIIAKFLYSKSFFSAWRFSIVLLIGFMFNSLSSFLGSIYTSSKETKPLFYTSLAGSLLNIICNFFLIPLLGPIGAAMATTFSFFVVWAVRLVDTKRIMDFNPCCKKNIITASILILQMLLMLSERINGMICSVVCFIVIVYMCRDFFRWILNYITVNVGKSLIRRGN